MAAAGSTPTRKPEVHEDEHPARKSDVARRAAATDGTICDSNNTVSGTHLREERMKNGVELPRQPLRARVRGAGSPLAFGGHVWMRVRATMEGGGRMRLWMPYGLTCPVGVGRCDRTTLSLLF